MKHYTDQEIANMPMRQRIEIAGEATKSACVWMLVCSLCGSVGLILLFVTK